MILWSGKVVIGQEKNSRIIVTEILLCEGTIELYERKWGVEEC